MKVEFTEAEVMEIVLAHANKLFYRARFDRVEVDAAFGYLRKFVVVSAPQVDETDEDDDE